MAWVGLWATCHRMALAPARNRLHMVLFKGLLAPLSFILHISDLHIVCCESAPISFYFIPCGVLIPASDWLTIANDRHVFNVWHHQRDWFNAWRYWWCHNDDRGRSNCIAMIVTCGLCTPTHGTHRDTSEFNFKALLRDLDPKFNMSDKWDDTFIPPPPPNTPTPNPRPPTPHPPPPQTP